MFDPKDIKPGEEKIWGMIMYRVLALPFVTLAIRLGIPPNLITNLVLFAGISTSYLIVRGLFVQGALLWQLVMVLDVCDGMVARRTSKTSSFGLWYDFFIDRFNYLLLFIALGMVIGQPVFWALVICSIALFHLVDISFLIWRLQTKASPCLDNRDKASFPIKKTFLSNSLKWLSTNFVFLHMHIFGFLGFFLFFSIAGIRFAVCAVTFILFLNLVYNIWLQIYRVGINEKGDKQE